MPGCLGCGPRLDPNVLDAVLSVLIRLLGQPVPPLAPAKMVRFSSCSLLPLFLPPTRAVTITLLRTSSKVG